MPMTFSEVEGHLSIAVSANSLPGMCPSLFVCLSAYNQTNKTS